MSSVPQARQRQSDGVPCSKRLKIKVANDVVLQPCHASMSLVTRTLSSLCWHLWLEVSVRVRVCPSFDWLVRPRWWRLWPATATSSLGHKGISYCDRCTNHSSGSKEGCAPSLPLLWTAQIAPCQLKRDQSQSLQSSMRIFVCLDLCAFQCCLPGIKHNGSHF